jgi:hypothetical protein
MIAWEYGPIAAGALVVATLVNIIFSSSDYLYNPVPS